MKRLLLIIVFGFTLISMHASARIIFGPQAGFSYATLTGTNLSLSPKPEWHAGLLIDLGIGKHFSLQPSLLYSRRGYKYDYTTNVTTIVSTDTTITTYTAASVDAMLGYIDIPVLLNVYFGDHEGFMINAGPQLSLLIANQSVATTTTTTQTNGGSPQTTQPETETKFSFNPADVSIVGGVGYKFPKLLMVYLRAATGFGKVQKGNQDKGENVIRDENAGHNFTFEAGLALTFGSK